MEIQDKSKEELISELQELRQENNILKALYDKDNSEHKRVEEVLKERERDLEKRNNFINTILENLVFGLAVTFIDSGVTKYINPAYSRVYGWPVEEMKDVESFFKLIYPDPVYCAQQMKMVMEDINSGDPERMHWEGFKITTKTGEERFIEARNIPVPDQNFMISTAWDITERKRAVEALASLNLKNELILNSAAEGILGLDLQGNHTFVNPAAAAMLGYESEELIGLPSHSCWHHSRPDGNPYPQENCPVLNVALNGEEHRESNAMFWRKDGTGFPTEYVSTPILEKGQVTGVVVTFSDITESKKNEFELIKAKEKAEESDKLKSAFLANMSHEIRTPMNGILGFSELLKEPDLTGEQQQEYIRIIEKSGARMLNIINDIVDISKIEAGLMNYNIKETDINEKIEFIYIFFKPQVEDKGMQLLFKNTLPAKEAIIRTDNEKVYSILTNLVKNAIKYSKEGEIEFGYIKKGETLEFYVKDTGIGIPKDRQSAIFERFVQADISDKMARQGAGLGLSISKAYVEMLGGKIWVESEEGIGSTFYFTLPYNAVLGEKNVDGNIVPSQEEKIKIKKLKILIAEDDETSEMLITIDVEKFGKEILKARTGFEAVEVCRNNPDTDLILMDIQMPIMNGHEATRQIRQFNKNVVIIAQTAFGLSGDREKAIEAGCNDYLSKPINKAELLSLIQKYFKK